MHMSGFDGLLVTAPVLVECLDEVELEAQGRESGQQPRWRS